LVGLIFSNILVLAQAEDNNADEILAKMKTQLNLTDTQVNDVTPIIKEYAGRRQALMQIPETIFSPSKRSIRNQMKELKEEENKELSKVLTPDQMKKWDHSENVKGFLNQDEIEGADTTPRLNGMSF